MTAKPAFTDALFLRLCGMIDQCSSWSPYSSTPPSNKLAICTRPPPVRRETMTLASKSQPLCNSAVSVAKRSSGTVNSKVASSSPENAPVPIQSDLLLAHRHAAAPLQKCAAPACVRSATSAYNRRGWLSAAVSQSGDGGRFARTRGKGGRAASRSAVGELPIVASIGYRLEQSVLEARDKRGGVAHCADGDAAVKRIGDRRMKLYHRAHQETLGGRSRPRPAVGRSSAESFVGGRADAEGGATAIGGALTAVGGGGGRRGERREQLARLGRPETRVAAPRRRRRRAVAACSSRWQASGRARPSFCRMARVRATSLNASHGMPSWARALADQKLADKRPLKTRHCDG